MFKHQQLALPCSSISLVSATSGIKPRIVPTSCMLCTNTTWAGPNKTRCSKRAKRSQSTRCFKSHNQKKIHLKMWMRTNFGPFPETTSKTTVSFGVNSCRQQALICFTSVVHLWLIWIIHCLLVIDDAINKPTCTCTAHMVRWADDVELFRLTRVPCSCVYAWQVL